MLLLTRRPRRLALAGSAALMLGAALVFGAGPGSPAARAAVPVYDWTTAAIAWTGSSVVVAGSDNTGDIDYWWQATGSTAWHQQRVATGSSGLNWQDRPSIAWTGNSVVIAATGIAGGLYIWSQPVGGTTWTEDVISGSGFAFQNTSIAEAAGSVILAVGDGSGNLDYWWAPNGSTSWHEQRVATSTGDQYGDTYYGPPAIAWTGSAAVIAAGNGEDCPSTCDLDYWSQAYGSSTWTQEQAAAAIDNGAYYITAIASVGSSVVIAASAADPNGAVYVSQPAGGTTWTQQTIPDNWGSAPPPSIAWTGSSVVVTTDDPDFGSGPAYWWGPASGTDWHQQILPASVPDLSYGNSSIAATGSSVVIADTDSDGYMDYWWQAYGSSTWHQQIVSL
jgi:hypothetical protein